MNVSFYLQNKNISDVDCSNPMSGNPGIGGCEYMFIAIPFCLWQTKDNNHRILLMANSIKHLPHHNNCIQVEADEDLRRSVTEHSIDAVVLRYSLDNLNIAEDLPSNVMVIMWSHNFIKRTELSRLTKDRRITCIVCVGNEQLQMYRDHQAFYKSVAIYNGYPINHFIRTQSCHISPFENRSNEVTFLGNLVDYKGFHLLAKAWKKILEAVPDAHLNVIGGGKLYDRNQKLGIWGIAEESFENMFMPYLLGDDGRLLPSVTFHGVMGNEKAAILNRTKVGVPNPSGISETFCIAALEMQLYGAIISTISYGGFKDTVYKTGDLYETPDRLAESVVKQLKKTDNDYSGVLDFVRLFDFSTVTKKWIELFDTLQQTGNIDSILKPKPTKEYRLAEWNRKFKRIIPFGNLLPSSMFYKSIFHRISSLLHKYACRKHNYPRI